ncbi:NAD-dependent SIR2 family protein deacetylase/predicted cupin superfamily sugar epimerase [Lactobacillus colini]|uniref:NAD-dependent SIR2 family protein deacetylase/predicted cupin superfamily sugar epimerase n=1 Tax=Lactobacillus colini TaxID=1819254 RepID=A0ABS4MGG2_9LACO|nr:Sir2 silent information regulator family NAD-dependent deacetylase [Lactobacillus colini]MBP2058775.1 NAD-dependent SIR2 family protein deacetylase/predicted cupin superfamily sugar epimerase [Lactobacillus colini]
MSKKDITLAHQWLKEADRILVTASNGLAISEGINLFANDSRLRKVLGDLVDKYHLTSLLQAFSFPYKDELDYWRMVARVAEYYNYNYQASIYMKQLKKLLAGKPYFIWTSNTDYYFVQAGFDRIFEVEGNWMTGVCTSHPDEHGTFNLSEKLHTIYQKDQANTLTSVDLPRCDKCNAQLSLNVAGEYFQPDRSQIDSLRKFLVESEGSKLLVLELGIGAHNQLIKEPSMELVASYPDSRYITINKGEINIFPDIADRSIGFLAGIGDALEAIMTGESSEIQTQGPSKSQVANKMSDKQEELMNQIYPNYMVDSSFHGSYPIYITIDKDHPALLHGSEAGQSWMYSIGDSATAHCFTPDGQYYKVKLGLDKSKNQVHGFYLNPGTLIAIEKDDGSAGFAQLSTNIAVNSSGRILLPKVNELIAMYPEQEELIKHLAIRAD